MSPALLAATSKPWSWERRFRVRTQHHPLGKICRLRVRWVDGEGVLLGSEVLTR